MSDRASLAQAAIAGFPSQFARFIDAVRLGDGGFALGLVLLNPAETPYPMSVWLAYDSEVGWYGLQATETDTDKIWWERSLEDDEGRWFAIGRAPAKTRAATLTVDDVSVSRPVVDGWYVLALEHAARQPASAPMVTLAAG